MDMPSRATRIETADDLKRLGLSVFAPDQLGRAFVENAWVASAATETFTVRNPADGAAICDVANLTSDQVEAAIATAKAALPAWKSSLPHDRAAILMRWHDLVLEHRAELAALMTLEQGKPLWEAEGEIAYGASFIRWFVAEASRHYGETIPTHLAGRKLATQYEALGVVALITPWNFPMAMLARKAPAAMITRKAAPALAAGCTVLSLPSRETPLSALALAVLAEKAGFPAGIFAVVPGESPRIAAVLAQSPIVRGVSFTGSTSVGQQLAQLCAAGIKRVSLELGGHAPFLLFPDVDLDEAVEAAIQAKFQTSGQDCLAANRIYVHRDIYERFVTAFVERVAALKVGPGHEAGVEIGPLIHDRALARMSRQIEDAVARGATLMTGGRRHALGGLFFEPTVLANVAHDMTICAEETFGPVVPILSLDGDAALMRAASDTDYGLSIGIFSQDIGRALAMANRLRAGIININERSNYWELHIPFGGGSGTRSGVGRLGGRHTLEAMTEIVTVTLPLPEM